MSSIRVSNKSILNVAASVTFNKNDLAKHIKKVFGTVGMFPGPSGFQICVRNEFMPAYLALEYGVAGKALPEKKLLFGMHIASSVVIPINKLKYSKWHMGKNRGYIVIYTRDGGGWKKVELFNGDGGYYGLPIRYKGVKPLNGGIVRGVTKTLEKKLALAFSKAFKLRYNSKSVPLESLNISKDQELKRIFFEELNKVAKEALLLVQKRTPISDRAPERVAQLLRAHRPTQHLREAGYYINFIERSKRNE